MGNQMGSHRLRPKVATPLQQNRGRRWPQHPSESTLVWDRMSVTQQGAPQPSAPGGGDVGREKRKAIRMSIVH